MSASIIPGAEPYSATGDTRGALVLHGFTGNPQSMRGLAAGAGRRRLHRRDAAAARATAPRIEDMLDTRWEDWSARGRERPTPSWRPAATAVVVVGLSMGGIAERVAGRAPPRDRRHRAWSTRCSRRPTRTRSAFIQAMIDGGDDVAPGIGSDIAMEGAVESAYPGLPLQAALSLFAGAAEVEAILEPVTCPVLVFTSVQDHVVDPVSSEMLVGPGQGPGRAGHPGAELPRGHAGLGQGRDRGAHRRVRHRRARRHARERGRRPGTG